MNKKTLLFWSIFTIVVLIILKVTILSGYYNERLIIDIKLQDSEDFSLYLPVFLFNNISTNTVNSITIQSNDIESINFQLEEVTIPGESSTSTFLHVYGHAKEFRLYSEINSIELTTSGGERKLFGLVLSSNSYLIESATTITITYHFSASTNSCGISNGKFEGKWGVFLDLIDLSNTWEIFESPILGIGCS